MKISVYKRSHLVRRNARPEGVPSGPSERSDGETNVMPDPLIRPSWINFQNLTLFGLSKIELNGFGLRPSCSIWSTEPMVTSKSSLLTRRPADEAESD